MVTSVNSSNLSVYSPSIGNRDEIPVWGEGTSLSRPGILYDQGQLHDGQVIAGVAGWPELTKPQGPDSRQDTEGLHRWLERLDQDTPDVVIEAVLNGPLQPTAREAVRAKDHNESTSEVEGYTSPLTRLIVLSLVLATNLRTAESQWNVKLSKMAYDAMKGRVGALERQAQNDFAGGIAQGVFGAAMSVGGAGLSLRGLGIERQNLIKNAQSFQAGSNELRLGQNAMQRPGDVVRVNGEPTTLEVGPFNRPNTSASTARSRAMSPDGNSTGVSPNGHNRNASSVEDYESIELSNGQSRNASSGEDYESLELSSGQNRNASSGAGHGETPDELLLQRSSDRLTPEHEAALSRPGESQRPPLGQLNIQSEMNRLKAQKYQVGGQAFLGSASILGSAGRAPFAYSATLDQASGELSAGAQTVANTSIQQSNEMRNSYAETFNQLLGILQAARESNNSAIGTIAGNLRA